MNPSGRGGMTVLILLTSFFPQERPDLVAKYAALVESGTETRRDLAAKALLTLGRPGHQALQRILAARPDLARALPPVEALPPAVALVRRTPAAIDPRTPRDEASLRALGTLAESLLWESLDSTDAAVRARAARLLRELYLPPSGAPAGSPSDALRAALDRKRDFDMNGSKLADLLKDEPVSWILIAPRDERITLRMRNVSMRDFLRLAAPNLAAVPAGDLLILIPPERIAAIEPADAVWATSDLAPRIETGLDRLARGDGAAIDGLTGVGAYHALKLAALSGGVEFSNRADALRKLLEQRIFFIGVEGDGEGPAITLGPVGDEALETVRALEKAAGRTVTVTSKSALSASPPAFRFRNLPAGLATRALQFRINFLP